MLCLKQWIRGVIFVQGFGTGDYEELMGFTHNKVLGSVTMRQYRVRQGVNCHSLSSRISQTCLQYGIHAVCRTVSPKMAVVLSTSSGIF